MTENEDSKRLKETWERILQIEERAKRIYIQNSEWAHVLDMLSDDEREELEKLKEYFYENSTRKFRLNYYADLR